MIDRKLVLEWAKKVGLAIDSPYLEPYALDSFVSLCELAQAEERDRCIQTVLGEHLGDDVTYDADKAYNIAIRHAVTAIREGSNHAE